MDLGLPADADPQLRQTIDQMKEIFANLATPLPEEQVGPGAKWEDRTQLLSQGMKIDQIATYELASIDGERANIKRTISQSAANQKVQNPAMPGANVDLTKMEGKGAANATLDLTQVLPREGAGESHSEMSMAMDLGAQKQTMGMKIDMTVRLESK
jgi:hypothetical protein